MSSETGKKRLYSFYIDPNRLERLTTLSGFLSVKNGKRVTVSNLINTAIEQYINKNEYALETMERISKEVVVDK